MDERMTSFVKTATAWFSLSISIAIPTAIFLMFLTGAGDPMLEPWKIIIVAFGFGAVGAWIIHETEKGECVVVRARGGDKRLVLTIDGEERTYTGYTLRESKDTWATHIPVPESVYREVDDARIE